MVIREVVKKKKNGMRVKYLEKGIKSKCGKQKSGQFSKLTVKTTMEIFLCYSSFIIAQAHM